MIPDPCPPQQDVRPIAMALQAAQPGDPPGYGHRLATSPQGPPTLPRWCVWLEPAQAATANRWEQRWLSAVDAALTTWQQVLPIIRVQEPERAQIRIERRRPPLRQLANGWRASNGRSLLEVLAVRRDGSWSLEPRVTVLVSPELRASVLRSTALHELGHAFGLWGHSDDPGDVMAVHQGHLPVLRLTARDRETLRWLQAQPTRFGQRPSDALLPEVR